MVEIDPQDIRIEPYGDKGAVRATHTLSGLYVDSNVDRSAHKNRTIAIQNLNELVVSTFQNHPKTYQQLKDAHHNLLAAAAKQSELINACTLEKQGIHPDDLAVDKFAEMMKAKLGKARAKGRSGWNTPQCTSVGLAYDLIRHLSKGDPVDVANFAMMIALRSGEDPDVLKKTYEEWLSIIKQEPRDIGFQEGYEHAKLQIGELAVDNSTDFGVRDVPG